LATLRSDAQDTLATVRGFNTDLQRIRNQINALDQALQTATAKLTDTEARILQLQKKTGQLDAVTMSVIG
jgi:peptidoglycan hydrolase CwlO-like protein